jgi:hypothetical protein
MCLTGKNKNGYKLSNSKIHCFIESYMWKFVKNFTTIRHACDGNSKATVLLQILTPDCKKYLSTLPAFLIRPSTAILNPSILKQVPYNRSLSTSQTPAGIMAS